MARPKVYSINLTDYERSKLNKVIKNGTTCKTVLKRCQILRDLDETKGCGLTHAQIAHTYAVCPATVSNLIRDNVNKGIDGIIRYNVSPNSAASLRKADMRAEARLIQIACGPAPDGHSRRTLKLLEEKSRVELENPISRETIRRALKKRNPASQKRLLVYPTKGKCRMGSHANTNAITSLYKTFPAQEAHRIARKMEIYDTPKHGSMLDMAEIELNVMTRQCLSRRIVDIDGLRQELAAWEADRNHTGANICWHFTTDNAREKMVSLYPKFKAPVPELGTGLAKCKCGATLFQTNIMIKQQELISIRLINYVLYLTVMLVICYNGIANVGMIFCLEKCDMYLNDIG